MTFSIIAHYFKLSVIMLSVIMLNFVMLSVVKLKIVMLSVVKLKVVMLRVVAPVYLLQKMFYKIITWSCILQFSLMPERNDPAYEKMT
jgi:hypothetical protein